MTECDPDYRALAEQSAESHRRIRENSIDAHAKTITITGAKSTTRIIWPSRMTGGWRAADADGLPDFNM